MDAGSNSLLAELRAATASAHAELDHGLGLLSEGVTRARYIAFLRGSLAALEPLEKSLVLGSNLDTPTYRERAPSLRADLASLGVNTGPTELTASPHVASMAARCGARYVIEGSALGGAVLARGLEPALGLQGKALAYLKLYGDELPSHWRAFVAALEHWGKSATLEMRAEACNTARAVFGSYRAAFEQSGAFTSHP